MVLICILIGYLFGSILIAELVAKAFGKDVRRIDPTTETQGNPGTMNVFLNIGIIPGAIVFIGDTSKLFISCLITYLIFGKNPEVFIYTGFGCLLGHDYSFLYNFNGGKGVAVTIAWIVLLLPKTSLLILLILLIITVISGFLNLVGVLLPIIATFFVYKEISLTAAIIMAIASIISIIRNKRDLYLTFTGQYIRVNFFERLFKKK